MVSVAPLLLSRATRSANEKAWREFWQSANGRRIALELRTQAQKMGFAATAFAPFWDSLKQSRWSEPRTLSGVDELFGSLLRQDGRKVQILTLVEDGPRLEQALYRLSGDDVTVLSPRLFRRRLSQAVATDFLRLALYAGGAVVVLVSLLLRRLRLILAALAPVVSGLAAMFGVMGWGGLEFNLFNSVASVLVIGLTIDYGLFMVWRQLRGGERVTERAVLTSGLTTLVGFGSLALASHPALFAIGISVLVGIGAAVPTALWLVPTLVPARESKT